MISFATNHYVTTMQLNVLCNYMDHASKYKIGIIFFWVMWLCAHVTKYVQNGHVS